MAEAKDSQAEIKTQQETKSQGDDETAGVALDKYIRSKKLIEKNRPYVPPVWLRDILLNQSRIKNLENSSNSVADRIEST